MLSHLLGVSGSTILSNPEQFSELFWEGITHIEIGEFPDERAFDTFLELSRRKDVSFGVHSPLIRSGSKYDLIQKVYVDPASAWEQLEREAEQLSALGAEYILVHFPYFKEEVNENANDLIEAGLQKLSRLQQKYSIPFICEPKLGIGRSPVGIQYLHHFPEEKWEKYGLKLCIDIGDYFMATGDRILTYLSKWVKHIQVVHLHNVLYEDDNYFWIPVHPSQEDGDFYKIEPVIRLLSESKDVTFIFEHTPHRVPSKQFVDEGHCWMKSLISTDS